MSDTNASPFYLRPYSSVAKDGQTVKIRAISTKDTSCLFELERSVVAEGHGVVKTLSDLPANAIEMQPHVDEWVQRNPAEGVRLVAEISDSVVADATAERLAPTLVNHVVSLSLQVHPTFQAKGIGRMMLNGLLCWSRQLLIQGRLSRVRLEVSVRDDNYRARALYESVGFVYEGVRRSFHHVSDALYIDDHVMGMVINN